MSEAAGFDIILDSVDSRTCQRCGAELSVAGVSPFTSHDCPECGHPFTVPARLGSFLLLGQLGKGGMGGIVYLAKDETLDRNVAIKVMPASLVPNEEVLATFKREAQAAARLNHPNIAQVYSFGQEHGQPYIVMELLSGVSLDRMMDEQGPLDEGLVLRVGLQIADALRAADEAGLIHGDIKPENILFDERMAAKLVDFGIATFANQTSDAVWGTPYYISPEKLRRQRVDARSDIYCLGGTLYHALTGNPPFDGQSPIEVVKARLERDPVPLRECRPEVHEEVANLVTRMLQREPAARYPTYASLISDIRKALRAFPDTSAGAAATSRGKKLVIKPTRKLSQLPPAMKPAADGTASDGDGDGDAPETPNKANRRGGLGRFIVVILILVVLAAVGTAVGWRVYTLREAKKEAINNRRIDLKVVDEKIRGEKAWTSIIQSESNTIRIASAATGCVEPVMQAIRAAIGETIELPPSPDEKQEPADSAPPAATSGVVNVAGATNAEVAAAVPAVLPPPPAEAAPAAEEPVIKGFGRRALQAVRLALDSVEAIKRMRGQAEEGWAELQRCTVPEVAAARADRLQEMADQAVEALGKARAAAQEADTLMRKVEVEKLRIEKQRATSAEAEAAAEQRTAAEKEARRLEEERKQMAESESGTVDATRLRCQAYVKQHAYQQGIDELEGIRAGIKTEAGIKALSIAADRYKRMAALKAFIIQHIKAEGYPWGWVQGKSPEDIIGADEKEVKLKARSVPWTEVTVRQYLQFINRVLGVRETSARVLADMNLAAAIYCLESAEGNEKALTASQNFGRRAMSLTPTIDEEVKRLLPFEF
jgi:hypothetical protein